MKLFRSFPPAFAIGAFLPGIVVAQNNENGQPSSTADGIYTMEQARMGSKVFLDRCLECHLPEQFAGEFMNSWDGAPVAMLYDAIATTMPADRPGALPVDEYSAVLAYIFLLNGIPAGNRKLEGGTSSITAIYIERGR